MSEIETGLAARVRALKEAFDRSFAEPAAPDQAVRIDLALIRIGTEPFALRLDEIGGLHADKVLRRLPGSDTALLGLAGFRGTILPVYGLAPLIGRQPDAAPRWLVLAAAAQVALAFGQFEGHLRVGSDAIQQHRPIGGSAEALVRAFVATGSGPGRPLLDIPSILTAIEKRRPAALAKPAAATGER